MSSGGIALFRKMLKLLALPLVLLLLLIQAQAFAGVSGKVSGVVVNAKTGEPIEGATVRVLGTDISTITDFDGEYFIINVPSGKYNISTSFVGFESVIGQDVRVLVDLTTPLDFELSSTPYVLEQPVIVSAANPVIQKDLTASKVIFTSDQLKTLPNIVTLQSILTYYPGVVVDANNSLHVRGGRAGQVTFYYDGFSIQDPFVSNSGLRVIPSALEELSLTSGGYTAEYGEALSGVVSAVSREGNDQYHGGIRVYEGLTKRYDVTQGGWGSLDFFDNRSISFNLSGPIPGLDAKKFTFFTAGEFLKDPTFLPSNESKGYTGTAKFSMQPMANMKLQTNFSYYKADGDVYQHRDVNDVSYDFNLDGGPGFKKTSYLAGITGNYNFSESMILSATFNRFHTATKTAPKDLMDVYWKDWPGYSEDADGNYDGTIHEDNYRGTVDYTDPLQVVGFTVGDDFLPYYQERKTWYNSFKLSMIDQVNKHHQMKTGVEYRKYNLNWDSKQFFNTNPYGELYTSKPTYASAFIQDKMEYDYFIVNLGLRFDYRNADISFNATPEDTVISWERAESKSRLSPRLGVSFPISEKSMIHFNYGMYYQEPQYTYLYTNRQGDISTGYPLLGNPNLEPEQTTAYEIGLDHLIGENLRLDVTAYYKDIKDLTTTRSSFEVAGLAVTHFDNDDYGTAKGIDLSLEKLPMGSHFSASVSYSYMIAMGNGSSATEPYYTYLTSVTDTLPPVSKYALDFDQRHTLTAVMSYNVPKDWSTSLYGMNVPGAWGFSFVGHYGSGLPYTPTDVSGNRLGERNEGRLPPNYTVDMRFNKDFFVSGSSNYLSLFIEVDNLFDRRNVLQVYSRTGEPDDDGISTGAGLALNEEELEEYDWLSDHDPQNYSPPRTIRTGLEFNF